MIFRDLFKPALMLSAWAFLAGSHAVARGVDEPALRAAAESAPARAKLAAVELKRIAGPGLDALAALPDGKKLAEAVLASPALLEDLLCSGAWPDDPAKVLRVLHTLWRADAAGFAVPEDRTTAVAVALTFGHSKWPEDKAQATYEYFRDSRRAGLLHPQFDALATWEKRYITSVGNNGGYGGASDPASLAWMRDNVKLPAKAYTGACWQAPYRLENAFGDSIHGNRYYAPFDWMPDAQKVRDVGGVCGSLSHYGANSARANGIPAITMGEPGHCAYAVRVARGNWEPAYSLSWQRGLHTSLWGHTWTQLVLQERVLADREPHLRSLAYLWQARALRDTDPDGAECAYRLALEAQPLHQPAWLEATTFLKEKRQPDAAAWTSIQQALLKSMSEYPEAAWQVIAGILTPALAAQPPDQRATWLLAFHQAIEKHNGPVMWDFGSALKAQGDALGGDTAARLAFFERVLAVQAGSKSWFAPTVAWGQENFGKDAGSAKDYFAALARVFASRASAADPDALRGALRQAVLATETAKNVDAFQALGKAAAALRKAAPLQVEPFPGELLSTGGMLTLSTTSGWDSPENHWGVIEPGGGAFHTASEVRPHAIVRLGRLGELSGIVIHDGNSGQNAPRLVPLKVSVSEDGTTWTQVFRTEKSETVWRIPLAGKAPRVQFIKVERDDDRNEVFHLALIHAYGRRLQ